MIRTIFDPKCGLMLGLLPAMAICWISQAFNGQLARMQQSGSDQHVEALGILFTMLSAWY